MIAAPVQCDVDGISKRSHYVSVLRRQEPVGCPGRENDQRAKDHDRVQPLNRLFQAFFTGSSRPDGFRSGTITAAKLPVRSAALDSPSRIAVARRPHLRE